MRFSAAAFHYFSKSPADLNARQAATLAGLVKNPVKLDPNVYPEKALQRRNTVLAVMARLGKIPTAEAEKLIADVLQEIAAGKIPLYAPPTAAEGAPGQASAGRP